MPTTTNLALRYPTSSAAPNVPQDIQNLAVDVDTALGATTGLQALTAASGWTALSDAKYMVKRGWALVNISFSRASWPAGSLVCTVPVGARPVTKVFQPGLWAGVVTAEVDISTAGAVTVFDTGNNGVNCTFVYPVP